LGNQFGDFLMTHIACYIGVTFTVRILHQKKRGGVSQNE